MATTRADERDFHEQIDMPGFQQVATVLGGRGFSVIVGTAVPR